MNPKIHRGYGALRVGRWSLGGADYFLTGCLHRPLTGLTTEPLATTVLAKLRELDVTGHWQLRTCVLMPDHFHALVTLNPENDLSVVMRRFKGPLAPVLRRLGLRWQESFYDHRLREDDDRLPVFRYIWLNPYRAELIGTDQKWPWYYCAPEDWAWFEGLTNEGVPFPEWLG